MTNVENEFDAAFSSAFDSIELEAAGCVPWVPDYGCCDGWNDYDSGLQERATELAWAALSALTAGRVGSCPVELRPCLTTEPCVQCSRDGWLSPFIGADGQWRNCARLDGTCSCSTLCEIVMPGRVAELVSVNVDGVDIELDNFRVDNGNRLVRQDETCFPNCQDLSLPSGAAGTVTITYVPGIKPNAAGLWAAGILACEFAKACTGGKCRLPSGVTSIVRQGLSMTLMSGMFDQGTGIREVDAYVQSINPHGLKTPPKVWSPDLPGTRHRVTTWAT